MSNIKLHNHIGTVNGVNYKLVNEIMMSTHKTIGSRDPKTVFNIKLFGHEVCILPFLVEASSWFSQDMRDRIIAAAGHISKARDPFYLSELDNVSGIFNIDVYNSLLPSTQAVGIRELAIYLMSRDMSTFIQFLFMGASECFQSLVVDRNLPHLNFKCKDFCNTQALSYYLCLSWLCTVEPRLYRFMGRQILKVKLSDLLKDFCPEGCLHYRYIVGEISARELYEGYSNPVYSDGSSVRDREFLSYLLRGDYDGYDLSKDMLLMLADYRDYYNNVFEYQINLMVGYCFTRSHIVPDLEAKCKGNELLIESLTESVEKQKRRVSQFSEEATFWRNKTKDLESQVVALTAQVAKHKTDEELVETLRGTQNELSSLELENTALVADYLRIKSELRIEKRKVKSLSSRLDGLSQDSEEIIRDTVRDSAVDIEVVVDSLRDKRIVIVGTEPSGNMVKKLHDYGFSHVKYFNFRAKSIGGVDILVILAGEVKHTAVWRARMLSKAAQVVYYNGTNVDELIMELGRVIDLG